jgi:cyclopropane fatty-acyl-phospholipid synthase-like methyltransferase
MQEEVKFSKPIDPRSFKQDLMADINGRMETIRAEAVEALNTKDTVEVDSCYICQSSESELALEMYGYKYVQCSNCGHAYLTPRLTEEASIEYFTESEEYASTYTDEAQINYRLENIVKPKIDHILDRIDTDNGQWLDVGCGIGGTVHYLSTEGWDAHGLEVSKHSVQAAKERFGIDLNETTLLEYANETDNTEYDVISFFGSNHVVTYPMEHLRHAYDLLADGGYIVLGTHNFDSVSTRILQTSPNEAVRFLRPPASTNLFSESSIRTAFDQLGFEPVSWWFFGLDVFELLIHLDANYDGFKNSPLYEYILTNFNEIQHGIDKSKNGDQLVVIGKKS